MLRGRTPWLPGRNAPPHLPFQNWGTPNPGLRGEQLAPWPAYTFTVSPEWTSGVYVALFVEGDETGRDASQPDRTTPDGRDARALFVVRAAPNATARILYKLPLLTYHAYNLGGDEVYDRETQRGHWCLYNVPRPHEVPRPIVPAVGLHRPGGGTGATPKVERREIGPVSTNDAVWRRVTCRQGAQGLPGVASARAGTRRQSLLAARLSQEALAAQQVAEAGLGGGRHPRRPSGQRPNQGEPEARRVGSEQTARTARGRHGRDASTPFLWLGRPALGLRDAATPPTRGLRGTSPPSSRPVHDPPLPLLVDGGRDP